MKTQIIPKEPKTPTPKPGDVFLINSFIFVCVPWIQVAAATNDAYIWGACFENGQICGFNPSNPFILLQPVGGEPLKFEPK